MKKIIITVIALSAQMAMAQEAEKVIEGVNLVSRKKAGKERQLFSQNAQSTETLQSYELDRNNPAFLEQSLGTMAGVQVDRRTQFGGQRVVVRGYGNDQKFNNWGVKFYLNGVPLTNADGVTILEDIDFSQINNIEVIKGPAATKYGGGVGGAVRFSILPEKKKNGVELSENVMLGSFKTFQTNTKVASYTDKSSVIFSYGHLESDGYRPRGNTNKNNYLFLGSFTLNDKQELSVYAFHNNSFEGVTGQISLQDYYAAKDPGNLAYARKNAANHFISSRAMVNHKWQILPTLSNNTSIFYTHLDTKRTAAGAAENTQQPSYGFRSEFTWAKDISSDFSNRTEVGAEYIISRSLISNYRFDGTVLSPAFQMRPISRASYFKYNNDALSVFLENRIRYNPWDLAFVLGIGGSSLGYDRADLLAYPGLVSGYNRDASFQKKFVMKFSPHIALQKKWRQQIFNLSYSEGFNAPTAATAFITGSGKTNDNLKVEEAKMWEFSVNGLLLNSRLDYQISVFDMDIKNKLTQLWNNDGAGGQYSYWSNTGHQVNRGLETSVGYLHQSEGFISKIEPYVNFSWYDFRYRDFKRETSNNVFDYLGKRVVGVPSVKYSVGLDIDTKLGVYIKNTFNYLSQVYMDFVNETPVKGFPQYNAKVGYKKVFGEWEFDAYLAGNNLTSHTNYAFLFVGNAVGDTDLGNGYPANVYTDVNPGPAKAYFFGGLNVKYRF